MSSSSSGRSSARSGTAKSRLAGRHPVLPCSRPQDALQDPVLLLSFHIGERESVMHSLPNCNIYRPHFVLHLPYEAQKATHSSHPYLKTMLCMRETRACKGDQQDAACGGSRCTAVRAPGNTCRRFVPGVLCSTCQLKAVKQHRAVNQHCDVPGEKQQHGAVHHGAVQQPPTIMHVFSGTLTKLPPASGTANDRLATKAGCALDVMPNTSLPLSVRAL